MDAVNQRATMLDESRFRLAELDRQDWIANADEGTKIEDVLDPAYWCLLAPKLKPFDHIEVRADDGSWIANLIVLATARTWARVKILNKFDLSTKSLDYESNTHKVAFKGPQRKWSVIRTSDGEYVKEGFAAKIEAEQWLVNYESNL